TYDSGTNCTAGIGRLCQVTDASGTTQYGYDAYGNVTREQKTELGINYITTYTYDAGNRVLSLGTPDGRTITYTRDALRRITSVSATVNGSSQNLVSSRTYRPDGLLLSQTYGNGIAETKQYDLQGRLTNQFLGSADTRVYGYDANSNLTSLQSLPQVGSYTYDALDRLTVDSITSTPSSTVNLSYDPNGNRTSDGTNTYSYTANSNQLNQVGSNSITLDPAGNTTSDGTNTYSYNNDGHLQSVTQGTTSLGSYVYNFQRQRTQKTANSSTTVYHYDTNGNLILETGTDGTSKVTYVYAENVPIAQITRTGGIDTVTYLHTDHEGTPRLGTDNTQAVVWRWEGGAFGNTPPTGTANVNLRFAGQYADAESGLFYGGDRYWDPRLGRSITADRMDIRQHALRWQAVMGKVDVPSLQINSYAYVVNNPLRWIDSTGFEATAAAGAMSPPAPTAPTVRPLPPISIPWWAVPSAATTAILGGVAAALYSPQLCKNEEDCLKEWREAYERCKQLIYEQMQQAAGRKKKRNVTGVTGGYTDLEECARGLVSERCGGNAVRY
ncbi:MAG: RHS repeat-associated core domain-containing protein, partial [Sulfurifustis sp.]